MKRFGREPRTGRQGHFLSAVLLVPAQYKDEVNFIAAAAGFGPDCISTTLTKSSDNSEWFGSHAWATPQFVDDLADAPQTDGMKALIVSVNETADSLEHMQSVMDQHGLVFTAVQPSENPLNRLFKRG